MFKKPIVTVILPCFNEGMLLSRAVKSILNQSFSNFELIVIDDGSTDNTYVEVLRICDERIRLFRNPKRKGKYSSYNFGLTKALGKYVCMVSANDISMPDRLEIQQGYMECHPKIGCIGSAVALIDEMGDTVGVSNYPLDYPSIKTTLLLNDCFSHSTLFFRRSLLKKHNLLYNANLRNAAGYDLIARCSSIFQIRNLNELLVKTPIKKSSKPINELDNQQTFFDNVRIKQLRRFNKRLDPAGNQLYLELINACYLTDDELNTTLKFLNGLLEKNIEIKLYNQSLLYKLFKNMISTSLSKLGGWSIEREVINFLNNTIPRGKTVLEFGSGIGTDALLKTYSVISVEHDEEFAYSHTPEHTCIHSPIKNGWYCREGVESALSLKFDVVIIDGPPGELRRGILDNLDIFRNMDSPFIFDDIDRELDRETMIAFCEKKNYNYEIMEGRSKKFAYCTKQ